MTAPGPDLHTNAVRCLSSWRTADPGQEALRQAFLGFLAAKADACHRSCEAGHLTASALVLDATGERTLLTLHPRVGRWLQLGGHCEPEDTDLVSAALREATEESGITGLRIDPRPLHLDVHEVTCSLGVPTRHFDVRFLVRAPVAAREVLSAESLDLRWFPLAALPADVDSVPTMVSLAMTRAAGAAEAGSAGPVVPG
ncbi:NUDIX hydrolase [Actinoalloteichus caeruleus]|uniref:NUDIX hydrolase n=1 Tax=Actinoalloteichus cyanogriseus TaxID=2893586 RepID=UPI0004AA3662|nr:NUDIX hydrolase [Actinoalloteichus caeruleus]